MKRIILLFIGFMIVAQSGAWAEDIYCRYKLIDAVHYGKVEGQIIHEWSAAPWNGGVETGHTVPLDNVKFLHPSEPTIIIGISGSYKEAWEGKTPFKTIRWFLKPPTSAASPGEAIELPAALDELQVETELVVIIGKTVKNADLEEAKEAIFGYTIGNDIVGSVDSYHKLAGEPADQVETLLGPALKHGDKFSPYGPFIYRGVDWRNRERVLVVKNEEKGKKEIYRHNTSNMIFPPEKIVSDLSRVFTLNPGDVIMTGTTAALPAHAGDVMEVSVEGLGTIINSVVASK
ncbi:MAG: DUF2437 domain-containing protein [Candidatus Omnitrophota bacterium]|jgi:2-keto-4-pentenoate hydratase/2-oxohepta-3-ene-1,7-dioic acid hydratase in catechol pathway|nr:MAG: DUF2437 domain-containing protein [Candidatus Omnitrophota bacterium]